MKDICETCGQESYGAVCAACQEVQGSCDCTTLSRKEYEEWLEKK